MEPYVGEIRWFAFGYAPRGWHACDGTLMNIQQNAALFALLGTIYGGDGKTTFALPDLRGRVAMGNGPQLGSGMIGVMSGSENVTLTLDQIPSHGHVVNVYDGPSSMQTPGGNLIGQVNKPNNAPANYPPAPNMYGQLQQTAPGTGLAPQVVANAGAGGGHENRQPSLAVNYCIAILGYFPSRE